MIKTGRAMLSEDFAMEENAAFERYLLPRLESYREFLVKNGVRAEMSMDADEIPGLIVFNPEAENFYITFMEGEQEIPEVMRITADHVDQDPDYRSILVAASEAEDVDNLLKFGKIALSDMCMAPYPTREMVLETDTDDSLGAEAALAPRINALMRSYAVCGVEDAEIMYASVPYIILLDGDTAFISSYEQIDDNGYLLHFRADVPFDEDQDKEELKKQVRAFNQEHYFVRCALGFEDLGIYEDESENVISFFACTPDFGSMKDDAVYGFFASLFESEYMGFFA